MPDDDLACLEVPADVLACLGGGGGRPLDVDVPADVSADADDLGPHFPASSD